MITPGPDQAVLGQVLLVWNQPPWRCWSSYDNLLERRNHPTSCFRRPLRPLRLRGGRWDIVWSNGDSWDSRISFLGLFRAWALPLSVLVGPVHPSQLYFVGTSQLYRLNPISLKWRPVPTTLEINNFDFSFFFPPTWLKKDRILQIWSLHCLLLFPLSGTVHQHQH